MAALALKCQARTLLGSKTADQPFEMPFLATVGAPLARECVAAVRALVDGATELACQPLYKTADSATGTRLHAALNRQRFDSVDLELSIHATSSPFVTSVSSMRTIVRSV